MRYPLQEIKEEAIAILVKIPSYNTYHNLEHTLYVMDQSNKISKYMNIGSLDRELLNIAALYHDTGYIVEPTNHEEHSCNLARTNLKKHGVIDEHILQIEGMIMATKLPQTPKNELECIIADADLEYLGTDKFLPIGQGLFKELMHYNPSLKDESWNDIQINFLSNHVYHTAYCKRYKERKKQSNLAKIKESKAKS